MNWLRENPKMLFLMIALATVTEMGFAHSFFLSLGDLWWQTALYWGFGQTAILAISVGLTMALYEMDVPQYERRPWVVFTSLVTCVIGVGVTILAGSGLHYNTNTKAAKKTSATNQLAEISTSLLKEKQSFLGKIAQTETPGAEATALNSLKEQLAALEKPSEELRAKGYATRARERDESDKVVSQKASLNAAIMASASAADQGKQTAFAEKAVSLTKANAELDALYLQTRADILATTQVSTGFESVIDVIERLCNANRETIRHSIFISIPTILAIFIICCTVQRTALLQRQSNYSQQEPYNPGLRPMAAAAFAVAAGGASGGGHALSPRAIADSVHQTADPAPKNEIAFEKTCPDVRVIRQKTPGPGPEIDKDKACTLETYLETIFPEDWTPENNLLIGRNKARTVLELKPRQVDPHHKAVAACPFYTVDGHTNQSFANVPGASDRSEAIAAFKNSIA